MHMFLNKFYPFKICNKNKICFKTSEPFILKFKKSLDLAQKKATGNFSGMFYYMLIPDFYHENIPLTPRQ